MRSGETEEQFRGDAIKLALLGHAHRNSLATMGVQAAAAIGVCLIALPPERHYYLIWLTAVLALLAIRLLTDRLLGAALAGRYMGDRLDLLARVHGLGLILSAALWGLLACIAIPRVDISSRYVLIIVLSALAGGAVGVLSPLRWTGRVYVSLILLPASLTLIIQGGVESTLGTLGVIFWIVMMVGHRNNHALLVDALRLRDENRDLMGEVERRSHDIQRMNQDLESRVRARTEELEILSDEAQVANRAKSQFLAMISHELRTPLNAIFGEGQLLEKEALTPTQRARLSVMKTASRVMQQLIDDVLDISQIEAGGLRFRLNVFSLDTLVRDIQELYQPLTDERGLSLVISIQPDTPMFRRGDQHRLQQILGNLISNAVKFTREGGVTVKIGGDDETFNLSVIDTGIGIDPKHHEAIFQRFVQVDSSSTREVGGIGLGLAICRELAQRMGGSLTVASASGVGSRFDFSAPIPSVIAEEKPIAEPSLDIPDGPPATILVVDDNPVNRRIIAALVEPFGIVCGLASSGHEALEAWRSQSWTAIFMDIHMPDMDGVEAARIIRAEEASGSRARTPIIAVTASVLSHEVETYRQAGMDDILAKPIEAAALADMLSRCVSSDWTVSLAPA